MKTLLTFALAMSMFLTGYAEPTNELSALSSVTFNAQNAKVTLLEGIGRVKITLKNAKGSTLYTTSHRVRSNVVLPLNLESLPAGKYIVRIQTKDSQIDYDIETVVKKVNEIGFKANVKALDDKFVKVSVYEMLEEDGVTVKIYDNNHRLVFKEIVEGGPFARKYEFKYLKTKGLYFTISDKNGNFQTYFM